MTADVGAVRASPVASGAINRFESLAYAHLGDPLASNVTRLPHPALLIGTAWFVLTVGFDLLLTIPRGTFLSAPPAFIGWWVDFATVLQEVFVFPLLAFFYVWAPRALLRAIRSLREQDIVTVRPEDEAWLAEASAGRRPRWIARFLPAGWLLAYVVLVAGVCAALLFWTYTSSLQGKLWFADPEVARVKVIFWFLNSYMAIWLIVRMSILITLLARLFGSDRDVAIEPLHPDGAGGLAPLSSFSLRLTAFIGLISATFVLVERNYFFQNKLQLTVQAIPVHAIAVFALVTSAFVFFAPLVAPHRIMATAKRERLSDLSRQFRAIERQIDPANLDTLTGAAPKLQLIRSVYAEIERFPVWPFDTRILRFFFVAVLGQPILAVAIDIFKGDLKEFAKVILGG